MPESNYSGIKLLQHILKILEEMRQEAEADSGSGPDAGCIGPGRRTTGAMFMPSQTLERTLEEQNMFYHPSQTFSAKVNCPYSAPMYER